MSLKLIRPVIMSGGAGTRLWPFSRRAFPKQLLPVVGDRSMLQQTAARVARPQFAPPLIVAGEEHRHFVQRQFEEAGFKPVALLLEPARRNTASVAALAAEWSLANGGDELLLLLPSDHVITDERAFVEAIELGREQALAGGLVTFGITPESASTQYGYIEVAEDANGNAARRIKRFVEKPDLATAESYLSSGRFLWNSGIFLFEASAFLQEMDKHLESTRHAISRAFAASERDGLFLRPDESAFLEAENISIDHGIMERTDRGFVVPVDMGWSDVGSWQAVWDISPRNDDQNVLQGDVVAIDTRNSLVRSNGQAMIATVGLDGALVVATRDAVLVAPLSRSEDVKSIVEALESDGHECAVTPAKVVRPWGSYEGLSRGDRFQIKHIVVTPGEKLSLQRHYHRSEHWVVVRGTAEVTVGDKQFLLQENESTYIPAGTTHRLGNPGKVPLELVEVQCGPYLGEDDIVRIDDQYGRQ